MIDSFEKGRELTTDIRKFIQNRIECYELSAIEKTSKIAQVIFTRLAIHSFLFFVLFFSGIALGVYFSQLFESYILGFLSVAGIFFLVGIFCITLMRKQVYYSTLKLLLKIILTKKDE
jgi:hypothetical protein